jgi:hypothetical protein
MANKNTDGTKAALLNSPAHINDSQDSSRGILDDYMNEDECAAELNVAAITLAIWRMKKIGPPVTRLGRKILYKRSSVRAWLAAQERPASTLKTATA